MRNQATIYTDGSCHGNPGPGGYAAIVLTEGGKQIETKGSHWHTTNNRMELTAVIEGLRLLTQPSTVKIITDSKYVANQINRGEKSLRSFVNTPGRLNADLWEQILKLFSWHSITAEWVRGHAGNKLNSRCDYLANGEATKVEQEKEIRLVVFSELLKDTSVTATGIANVHHYPLRTVLKYYDQFFNNRVAY